jgi:hypothetical protein
MTAQEQQMIDELVDRIRNTQLTGKDPEAEQRLQQGLAGYPDAVYVLAQTVLVQKYGLEQAQQKIQAMQAELDQLHQQPKPHGSFLGNLLGIHDEPQPATPPYQPVNNPGYPAQAYPPAYAQPVYAAPQSGGFLRSAMQTAAGVAAGEMMFQGMESLFHGFGAGGGYGGYGYGESRPTEVINNNYYGDDNPHDHHAADTNDSSFYNPSDDASRDNDTSQFADTANTGDSQDFNDNSQDDFNSSGDDYSSTDDGGDNSSF